MHKRVLKVSLKVNKLKSFILLFKINFRNVEIIIKEDLQKFRVELLNDIKSIMDDRLKEKVSWLRSSEIMAQLKIYAGKSCSSH